jgi:hypothetical protein
MNGQGSEQPVRKSKGVPMSMFVLVMIGFVALGGTLLYQRLLGPDDSDMLAAEAMAEEDEWSSPYSTEVLEDSHDIVVIRFKVEQAGEAGSYLFSRDLTVQVCRFDSRVGSRAPKRVGSCDDILRRRVSGP